MVDIKNLIKEERLVTLGFCILQAGGFNYNFKGWLRTLNTVSNLGTDLFALDLRYNIPGNADALTASARHNGNISEMRWDTGTPKGYGFTYDGVNRLTAADYADGSSFTSNQNRYNTSYGYDNNGNLSSLSRYLNATQIDNLTYSYFNGGNKLNTVADAGTTEGYHAVAGNYGYDVNGNMITDPSKGTTIEYNYMNLPKNVEFGANDNLRYTYDAAGNKLVKVVDGTVAGNNTRLDYSGNFLYENNELKAIFTSAGRIVPFDNNGNIVYKFEYNLQDHLGNTRVVFSGHSNGQPEVMQVTDYYPFGMVMNQENYFASGVLSNKYLYNGKELQDDELAGNSLGWYDYGARFYDPQLGRWHSVDPMAEKYSSWSPYAYCLDNPIIYIDPDGKEVIDTQIRNHPGYQAYLSTKYGSMYYNLFKTGEMKSHNLIYSYNKGVGGGSSFGFYDKQGNMQSLSNVSASDINGLKMYFKISVSTMDKTSGAGTIAQTLGHETFLHNARAGISAKYILNSDMSDAKKAEMLQGLVGAGDINWQGSVTTSGQKDHAEFAVGQKSTYNEYLKQLKGVLSPEKFSSMIDEVKGMVNQYINGQDDNTRTIINYYIKYNMGLDPQKSSQDYSKQLDDMK